MPGLRLPAVALGASHVYHLHAVHTKRREALLSAAAASLRAPGASQRLTAGSGGPSEHLLKPTTVAEMTEQKVGRA